MAADEGINISGGGAGEQSAVGGCESTGFSFDGRVPNLLAIFGAECEDFFFSADKHQIASDDQRGIRRTWLLPDVTDIVESFQFLVGRFDLRADVFQGLSFRAASRSLQLGNAPFQLMTFNTGLRISGPIESADVDSRGCISRVAADR